MVRPLGHAVVVPGLALSRKPCQQAARHQCTEEHSARIASARSGSRQRHLGTENTRRQVQRAPAERQQCAFYLRAVVEGQRRDLEPGVARHVADVRQAARLVRVAVQHHELLLQRHLPQQRLGAGAGRVGLVHPRLLCGGDRREGGDGEHGCCC